MIKKKYIFILFAFSISFWLSGCIKDPKVVGISNLEIVEKVDSMLLTTMTTQIENPNKMSITASDLEYSIMLQGREIGQGFVKEEFTLKANEITDIQNTIESVFVLKKPKSLLADSGIPDFFNSGFHILLQIATVSGTIEVLLK